MDNHKTLKSNKPGNVIKGDMNRKIARKLGKEIRIQHGI